MASLLMVFVVLGALTAMVETFFLVMGIMLAGVGILLASESLIVHKSFATEMVVMYLRPLGSGPRARTPRPE